MYLKFLLQANIKTIWVCQFCRRHSSWSSRDVRSAFISYFQDQHDHKHVPSSSVIPGKGQGTYFTNAGMNQFKPLFLETVKSGSRLEGLQRVVTSQKCIRVGGKHNDLEDVGRDLTHHTFFEMMGSWSFGDYFKTQACCMALELLCEVYGLSLDRLYFTYFGGHDKLQLEPDTESRDIWLKLGVPPDRVLPFGMGDNFWDMGVTGPCGPCTEIHFDHVGGRDAGHLVNADSPEVVEIWNLVFMQYNRITDGGLQLLPRRHVDTGMGLERMTAVLQGSRSNYDTDLFQPIFKKIQQLTGAPPYQGLTGEADTSGVDRGYRVVADHSRMMTVAITDGLLPGRLGLQHKLRSIIHSTLNELEGTFKVDRVGTRGMLEDISAEVITSLGETYPELNKYSNKIHEVLRLAGEQYHQLQSKVKATDVRPTKNSHQVQDQEKRIESKDHYQKDVEFGTDTVSVDLDLARLSNLHTAGVPVTDDSYKYSIYTRTNAGYDFSSSEKVEGKVLRFLVGSELCDHVTQGTVCAVVMDKTCFYAEGGGQASDIGHLRTQTGVFDVLDVQEHTGYVLHIGLVRDGELSQGQSVNMELNQERRVSCMCNHTATHLLQAALKAIIGDTHQMGSDIQQHKFTFDFASLGTVTMEQVSAVEKLLVDHINAADAVYCHQMELQDAVHLEGITMMENEDYPSPVRVVSIGEMSSPWSVELCGGTHVYNTRDIGDLCVVKLVGVSQGTKRATCVTGDVAKQARREGETLEARISELGSEVMTGQHVDTWEEKVKVINTCLHSAILPKLVRDSVLQRLEMMGKNIKAGQNKLLQASLQQFVLDLISQCSRAVVVQRMSFDGKQMTKALSRVEITKPVVLVSEGEKSSIAFIAAPRSQADVCTTLAESCRDKLSTRQTEAKCGQDKLAVLLTLKGENCGQQLYSVIADIVDTRL